MTWNCYPEDSEPDHNWRVVRDWYGDSRIPNGTADCSSRRVGQGDDHALP